MAGQVKFVVDAETGKAVAGFLKIVEAQKKSVDGFVAMKKPAQEVEEHVGAIGHAAESVNEHLNHMVTGFLSLEGAKELISKVVEELEHAREELKKFHESAAGGESLPDYVKNLPAFKARSIALSNQFGADVDVVNKVREKVYTESSDQSPEQREQMVESALRARHMLGADASAVAGVEDNMMDAYNGLSVKQAENAMMFFRDKGGMSVGDQAETLPGVLPMMSHLNVPFEQVQALMGMVPQMGGANSAGGRGLKEALFKFDELADEGVITKGAGLFENFQELAKLNESDPQKFNKLLGKRGAPAVSFVAKHPEMYQSLLGEAQGYGKGDAMEDVEAAKMADTETRIAIQSAQTEQVSKNATLQMGLGTQQKMLDYERAKAGARTQLPAGFKWTAGGLAIADSVLGHFGTYGENSSLRAAGTPVTQVPLEGGGAESRLAAANAAIMNPDQGLAQMQQSIDSGGGGGEALAQAATKINEAAANLERATSGDRLHRNLRNNAEH